MSTTFFKAIASNNDEEEQRARRLIQALIDRHGFGANVIPILRQGVGFHTVFMSVLSLKVLKLMWLVVSSNYIAMKKIFGNFTDGRNWVQLKFYVNVRRFAPRVRKMSIIEQDRAALIFADLEDGAQVFWSLSIGSEGEPSNSRQIESFDLPTKSWFIGTMYCGLPIVWCKNVSQIYALCRKIHLSLSTLVLMRCNLEQTCPMGMALFSRLPI